MSCCFHVCPSNISLQFDTTMMYIMMTLCFVKIYQFRHPDTSTNAYHCLYILAVVLLLEAVSLYLHNQVFIVIFYTVFTLLYLALILGLVVDIYYYGADHNIFPIIVKQSLRSCDSRSFLYPRRFVWSILFTLGNLCLLVYCINHGGVKEKSLSSPLLIIFALNMAMYFSYYMVRKLMEIKQIKEEVGSVNEDEVGDAKDVDKKKSAMENLNKTSRNCLKFVMRLFSFVFFLLALILGLAATYFYSNKHQSRNMTPPESRNKNTSCQLFDFFDYHDLWHFLSSTALFLTCIGLLTVDDDLLCRKRRNIEVF